MKFKKLVSIMGLGLGLTVAGPSFGYESWFFQDDDIDFLLTPVRDGSGNVTGYNLDAPGGGGDDTIDVGDVLFSVFELPTFTRNGNNAIPTGQELTGVAAIRLIDKDANNDTVENDWVFGAPEGNGLDLVLDSITPGLSARLMGHGGPGSILAMWLNNATDSDPAVDDRDLVLDAALNPATNCVSLIDCTEEATKGSLLQVDGFSQDPLNPDPDNPLDPDEFWNAFIPNPAIGNDINTVHGLGIGTQVAAANFALSNFYNTVVPVLFHDVFQNICFGAAVGDADGCVQVRGFSTIVGGSGLSNGAFAHSDANATKFVPEPATLALFGIGLLGFGASARRKV